MVAGVLTYIGECACQQEYILAVNVKPLECVACGERPLFTRPDPECWTPGGSDD